MDVDGLPSPAWQKFHRWRWGRWGWRRSPGWSVRCTAPGSCPQRPQWSPRWWPATLRPTPALRCTQCPGTCRTEWSKVGMSWWLITMTFATVCKLVNGGYDSNSTNQSRAVFGFFGWSQYCFGLLELTALVAPLYVIPDESLAVWHSLFQYYNLQRRRPPQTLTEDQRTRWPGRAEQQQSRRWSPGCWWRWGAPERPSYCPPYQLKWER